MHEQMPAEPPSVAAANRTQCWPAHLLGPQQYIEQHRGEGVCQDDIIIINLSDSIGDQYIVRKDDFLLDVGVDLVYQLLLCICFMCCRIYFADLINPQSMSQVKYLVKTFTLTPASHRLQHHTNL